MDGDFLISLAAQIPLVALFAWFVIRRDREWREFFTSMRAAESSAFEGVSKNLQELNEQLARNTIAVVLLSSVEGQRKGVDTEEILKGVLGDK